MRPDRGDQHAGTKNGAKWRSLPEEFGPGGWRPKPSDAVRQTRWARLGVWERLLSMAQDQGIGLGMTFLDGTSVRAHAKAAGAAKKARQRRSGMSVRRLVALVAASAPRSA